LLHIYIWPLAVVPLPLPGWLASLLCGSRDPQRGITQYVED